MSNLVKTKDYVAFVRRPPFEFRNDLNWKLTSIDIDTSFILKLLCIIHIEVDTFRIELDIPAAVGSEVSKHLRPRISLQHSR